MTAQGYGFALSRRSVLQLTAGAGLAFLAGCRSGLKPPQLLAARGTLPKAWQDRGNPRNTVNNRARTPAPLAMAQS